MKVVILAGGYGTRLTEETVQKPKPMVEIGGLPLLLHIMNIYATQGHREFVIALGYKKEIVRQYFSGKSKGPSVFFSKTKKNNCETVSLNDWTIHLVDTGLDTGTAGRLKHLETLIGYETFMMTYGDGVANIDLKALLAFHHSHHKSASITAVRPPARFGSLKLSGNTVLRFQEKSQTDEGWINGGFFVLEPSVFGLIENEKTMFEREPLEKLAASQQLMAYKHEGFWQCVDTLRDLNHLNNLWKNQCAPWKIWQE